MSASQMTGAEMVIKALVDQGVDVVFGYPGGAVLPIYDALFKQNRLRHILVRHEQGAVHAAEGYARSTGKVGAVLVTSGPGATNAVTGLTDALMDSVPIVCLTGQVPTHLIGNDAFQEADTTGITRPCTKHNYLVKDVNDLARMMHEAFYVARTGRPGPVVVDLPKDVLFATGTYRAARSGRHAQDLSPADRARSGAHRGGGRAHRHGEAAALLRRRRHRQFRAEARASSSPSWCKKTGFPCTLTLMGLGAFPASDRQFLGLVGMHGTFESNHAMHDCDVMICVGARFDDRVTGRLNAFSPGSKKIHIDIDPSSINKNVRVDVPVLGDAAQVLEALRPRLKRRELQARRASAARNGGRRSRAGARATASPMRKSDRIIKPQYAIERLYRADARQGSLHHHRGRPAPDVGGAALQVRDAVPLDDLGRARHHGLWPAGGHGRADRAARRARHRHRRRSVDPDEHPGDVDDLPVPPAGKGFILNNQYMGMVRQWQELTAWRALQRELHRLAARFRQARRGVRRGRLARREAGRCRPRHQGDAGGRPAGAGRHGGRSDGELLPDDPLGRRA